MRSLFVVASATARNAPRELNEQLAAWSVSRLIRAPAGAFREKLQPSDLERAWGVG
jgi:hypothetical protein